MIIKSIKLRFDKWKHSTEKAHLLVYRGKEMWLPKKLCWDFQIAGNDLHAWATIPGFLFEKITGQKAEDLHESIGTIGLKDSYGAILGTVIEHHIPERKEPVDNNTITDLKKTK